MLSLKLKLKKNKAQPGKLTRTGLQRLFLELFGFTNFIHFSAFAGHTRQPVICGVPGGAAAWNRGADYVKYLAPALAPEQGT